MDPSRDRFLICAEPSAPLDLDVPLTALLDPGTSDASVLAFAFCFPSERGSDAELFVECSIAGTVISSPLPPTSGVPEPF